MKVSNIEEVSNSNRKRNKRVGLEVEKANKLRLIHSIWKG